MSPSAERKPITLRAPITLGVVMIVLVVILGAVWVSGLLWGILSNDTSPELFGAMLAAGSVLLIAVLAGVIAYLTLSVKAFNLNRRQSNFIDAVTHELKSPIASLKLYLQTMTRHEVSGEQQAEFHKIMLDDVERLDSLINHLLDAARVERGVALEETVDLRLAPLLSQCGSAACVRQNLPEEAVVVQCPDVILKAPVIQMEILFRNLIDNAIKYGGSPPRVDVAGELSEAGEITVSISDNGAGIPANLRRKVFGRFVRLGNELERSKQGTGLGLYLVRNITHAMGGRINISDADHFPKNAESESSANGESSRTAESDSEQVNWPVAEVNRGTRFDITLPNASLVQPGTPESPDEVDSTDAIKTG